jgi:hypothetical protein
MGDKEAKFWLHDLSVAVNSEFPAHELNDILRHLKLHHAAMQAAWNEYFGN